jgi:zinc/manganese transport system permease protein
MMFAGFMVDAWLVGTIVGALAGLVGCFVVLRGRAFPAHAIPNGAFAGAAGASLVGADPLVGLVAFSALSALGIARLTRRARSDVATALWLVAMLALGAAFLSFTTSYANSLNQLLFGEILGVSPSRVLASAVLALVATAALAVIYRPLLFSSASAELSEARGVREGRIELAFLLVLALAAALTVPVVGALLSFSLMIGPAAAGATLARRPLGALGLSVALALGVIWAAIASSYLWSWPIGAFVGAYGLAVYSLARAWRALRRAPRAARPRS